MGRPPAPAGTEPFPDFDSSGTPGYHHPVAITKVWVDPGCVRCMLSRDTCPEVFEVGPDGAFVKPGADFVKHDAKIREAAEGCPVGVIKFQE